MEARWIGALVGGAAAERLTGTAADECWIGALADGTAAECSIGVAASERWIGLPVGMAGGTLPIPEDRNSALAGEAAAACWIGAAAACWIEAAAECWIDAAVSEDWIGLPVCVADVGGPVPDSRAGSLVGTAAGPVSGRIGPPAGMTNGEPAFRAAAGEGVRVELAAGAGRAADDRWIGAPTAARWIGAGVCEVVAERWMGAASREDTGC